MISCAMWLHPIYLWVPPERGPKSCISNIRVGLGSRGVLMVIGAFGSALATTTKTTAPTATATAAEDFLKVLISKMLILKMLILKIAHFENAHFENAHF